MSEWFNTSTANEREMCISYLALDRARCPVGQRRGAKRRRVLIVAGRSGLATGSGYVGRQPEIVVDRGSIAERLALPGKVLGVLEALSLPLAAGRPPPVDLLIGPALPDALDLRVRQACGFSRGGLQLGDRAPILGRKARGSCAAER